VSIENDQALAGAEPKRPEPVRKLRPGPGHSAAEVRASQLTRLRTAMVELTDEVGYEAVTVRGLAGRAEVSTRTFYQHFKGKQECLLDTYAEIMQRAARRVSDAHRGEKDGRDRLRLALDAFARHLADDPPAARLALVEVSAVGLAALSPMREVSRRFEAMLAGCIARVPGGADSISEPMLKAIAAGVVRVARVRVIRREEAELPGSVDELLDWVLCLGGEAAADFERRAGLIVPATWAGRLPPVDEVARNDDTERRLLLSAATDLAAREGYWRLSGARISAEAGLSPRSFAAHFKNAEACFFACLQLLNDRLLALAERESARAPSWPSGIGRALSALAGHSARDPSLARLAFIDVFAPGVAGLRQRELLLGIVTERFRDTAPARQRPDPVAADASIGAIWGAVHHYVAAGRADRLPGLVSLLWFLALAPAIGAERASHLIRSELRGPAVKSPLGEVSAVTHTATDG